MSQQTSAHLLLLRRTATPEAQRANLPGLPTLPYRVGTYADLLGQMQTRIKDVTLPDGPYRGQQPLRNLHFLSEHDLVLALLRAWAAVGDVLTFYQERIANEGYLRTASEARSVLELVRMLGYRPRPALSAATYLAFTMQATESTPTSATVPARTPVQSVPDPGRIPLVFETSQDLEGRVAWNELPVCVPMVARLQTLGQGTTEVRIQDLRPGLPAGTFLLIADAPSPDACGPFAHYLRKINRVQVDQREGVTVLGWDEPLAGDQPLQRPQVWLLWRRAHLFGHNAAHWLTLPASVQHQFVPLEGGLLRSSDGGQTWQTANNGLPELPVHALTQDQAGRLFAGTPQGVLRSVDGGQSWQAASTQILPYDIRCLAVSQRGQVLAGSATGGVFRSSDGGVIWEPLPGSMRVVGTGRQMRTINGLFPTTAVRALATLGHNGQQILLAGTDKGVLRSVDAGQTWVPACQGLPGCDPASGFADLSVTVLMAGERAGEVFAGTSQGVYLSTNAGESWVFRSDGLPGLPDEYPVFAARAPGVKLVVSLSGPPDAPRVVGIRAMLAFSHPHTRRRHLLVGSDQGLFHSTDAGAVWLPLGLVDGQSQPVVVTSLAALGGTTTQPLTLFAGTSQGLFCSVDQGQRWQLSGAGPIFALLAQSSGLVWAATPPQHPTLSEWPDFRINAGQIDLDSTYTQFDKRTWMVLFQQHPLFLSRLYRPQVASVVSRSGFQHNATMTRLMVPPDELLGQYDLRQASVLFDAEPLVLHVARLPQPTPLQGDALLLQGLLGDLPAGRLLSVAGRPSAARLIGEIGGVWCQDEHGWVSSGPLDQAGDALALDAQGNLLLGTTTGVLCRRNTGWQALGPPIAGVSALVCSPENQLVIGTPQGAFGLTDQGWQPERLGPCAIYTLLALPDQTLLAGTSQGLWQRTQAGWQSGGLDQGGVYAVLQAPDGTLYVGTDRGVLGRDDRGWREVGDLARRPAALAWNQAGLLIAGTPDGLYQWSQGGWEPCGLQGLWVQTLVLDHQGDLYVGTRGQGLWTLAARSQRWVVQPLGLSNDVRALRCDPQGRLLAATSDQCFASDAAGQVQTTLRPNRRGVVAGELSVCLNQGQLSVALRTALEYQQVALAQNTTVSTLIPGRCWLLRPTPAGDLLVRQQPEGLAVYASPLLEVQSAPTLLEGSPVQRWQLKTPDGRVGLVLAHPEVVSLEPAPPDWPVRAEIARVALVEPDVSAMATLVRLMQPLLGIYDPESVRVCANVVHATHGETLALDVLGSGDYTQTNQRFALHKAPLTYLSAPTPSGVESSLQIRVRQGPATPLSVQLNTSGILWSSTDTLAQSGPRDRHYALRQEADGRTSVVFGDGHYGARLPSGAENVVATYRTGGGSVGNLEAHRLTTLTSRPMGTRRVSNPVPASGGTAAESPAHIRQAAPLQTRALGRIVALRDFEDVSRRFAGVGKAYAQHLHTPAGPLVYLTLASLDGAALDPQADICRDLSAALLEACLVPPQLRLGSYRRAPLCLTARVLPLPDVRPDELRATVQHALMAQLCFEQRDFQQPLGAGALTRLIQSLPGVLAVRLAALHHKSRCRELNSRIEPERARWSVDRVLPAEILLIDSTEDLHIQIVTHL